MQVTNKNVTKLPYWIIPVYVFVVCALIDCNILTVKVCMGLCKVTSGMLCLSERISVAVPWQADVYDCECKVR